MPVSEHKRAIGRSMVLLAVLCVVIGVIWYGAVRMRALQADLEDSEQRMGALTEDLQEYSRELEQALDRARAERERATEATESASREQAARLEAEAERERTEVALLYAESEADRARAEVQTSRAEIENMIERRRQELDRMQEALNRIAPAKRTPTGIVMTLSGEAFRFDFDDDTLRADNREMLSRIAGILLASEGYRLFIDGHTDDVGTVEYNHDLSERRANSVRTYLIDAGIPGEVMETHGFGKTQPLVDSTASEARARNRRVEIGIVDTIIKYRQPIRD